jgi:fucose permease
MLAFVLVAALPLIMGLVPDVAESNLVPAACFAGVAIYAWFLSKPEPEELPVGAI